MSSSRGGNGVILERLSGKKLSILVSVLALLQFAFFLIGAIMFPNSTHTETVEGTMCKDVKQAFKNNEHMFYLRDNLGHTNANCQRVQVDENRNLVLDARANEIVYAFQVPLPRDDRVLRMHRFFQTMTAILQLQVLFPPSLKSTDERKPSPLPQHNDDYDDDESEHYRAAAAAAAAAAGDYNETAVSHPITLRAKLGYHSSRQLDHEWSVLASAKVSKEFTCYKNPYSLDCDMVQLFELGSVFHEFYAVNVKLDEKTAESMMGAIKNAAKESELPDARLTLTFIYQTGGFTQMWLTMKTAIFPFVLLVMCWSWNRIAQLERNANLLEKNLLALGLSLTLLNLPVEWFTLIFDMPWILIYADLRQGVFYAALFTFWIIFCGEHLMDENQMSICTTMKSYWKYISGVWVGFVCLLGFEIANRGMQLSDPFFSIWDTKKGSDLAMVMLVIASLSALFYFALLLYMVGRVFYNFHVKQAQLPGMNRMRRAFYEGIIYRFKFLLAATLFCAATTVAFFIVNNVNETQWRFHDDLPYLNYNAGFYTGVYGMWNIYVVAIMIFYAPSHKNKPSNNQAGTNENEETVEFVNLQTRLTSGTSTESVLTAFANKISSS